MDPLWFTAAALFLAGWMFGLWRGERHARIFIQNVKLYGGPDPMKRAVMSHPDDPESRIERAIDSVLGNGRKLVVDEDEAPPAYDPQTIENGVQYLLEEARMRGEQLSEAEARDEAIRMLNAEGPEMA